MIFCQVAYGEDNGGWKENPKPNGGYLMEIVMQESTGTKSAWEELERFVLRRERQWQTGEETPVFASYEQELHEHLMKLERELLAAELERYDVAAKEIEVEGERYRRVMLSGQNYLSSAGEVWVERHLYRRVGGDEERCICPLELRVGIISGYATPRAARQMNFAAAHLPPREVAALFVEIGGMTPSHTTIDNQPKIIAEVWELKHQQWEEALRQTEKVPPPAAVLAVSLDGVMAPVRQADGTRKEAAAGKQGSGPLGYREIGCGSVVLYDQEGQRLRTVRYGRMPEPKKATLRQQLTAECQHLLHQAPHLKVVKLADGARDNWDYLSQLELGLSSAPQTDIEQLEIVDFCHAADHLKRGCEAIWPHDPDKSQAKFETLRTALKEVTGGADKVIGSFRYHLSRLSGKNKEALQTELTYFRNQRPRMDYAAYIQQGLPIASGVIEATCKTLVTQRMKCSGMRWSMPGGQAILTLRSLVQSDRWQQAWSLIQAEFCKPVSIVKEQTTSKGHQNTAASMELTPIPDCLHSGQDYYSLPLGT
jgi:hypothetical protein